MATLSLTFVNCLINFDSLYSSRHKSLRRLVSVLNVAKIITWQICSVGYRIKLFKMYYIQYWKLSQNSLHKISVKNRLFRWILWTVQKMSTFCALDINPFGEKFPWDINDFGFAFFSLIYWLFGIRTRMGEFSGYMPARYVGRVVVVTLRRTY